MKTSVVVSDKIFGTDLPNPPYRFVGVNNIPNFGGVYEFERVVENWVKVLCKKTIYNRYFNYYECKCPNGSIWYHREIKEEYEDIYRRSKS